MLAIDGDVAPGFGPVRDAFAANFETRGEIGAAVCVHHRGRPVVDLWGGIADSATERPWHHDTVVLVYSMTKGVSAVCAHLLAERDLLDLDAPVARYWPEFAAQGKASIPVRWILAHRAGLAVIDADLTRDQTLAWFPVVNALAAQAPNWEPGTKHGYHLRSFGWLVGELVRRIDGRTIGRFFAEEVAAPLGLEFWIGLPEAEEPRVATLVPPPPEFHQMLASLPPELLLDRATTGPSGHFAYDARWNERTLHACELPSSNGIGTARAVARLYASLIGEVDGIRTLQPETVATATTVQSQGIDAVLMRETTFGLGFMLPPTLVPGAGRHAFGHGGAGGSVAFADPEAELSFTYAMNHLRFDPRGDPRSESLVRATYAALGGSS
jgi:CubicO group peptidase (beta-lactamase class C family)